MVVTDEEKYKGRDSAGMWAVALKTLLGKKTKGESRAIPLACWELAMGEDCQERAIEGMKATERKGRIRRRRKKELQSALNASPVLCF